MYYGLDTLIKMGGLAHVDVPLDKMTVRTANAVKRSLKRGMCDSTTGQTATYLAILCDKYEIPMLLICLNLASQLAPQDPLAHYNRGTALHELGHAFGLWGHSDQAGDAMAVHAGARPVLQLSPRDRATLQWLQSQPGLRQELMAVAPTPSDPAHLPASAAR